MATKTELRKKAIELGKERREAMTTNEEEQKFDELKAAIKSQGELHEELMHPEGDDEEEKIQLDAAQKAFDNVLKGTKQLAEIELERKKLAQQKEKDEKDRKNRTLVEGIKTGCEIATTAAVMIFTACENKKSRIFETSADYMSSVSKSTNKLVQSIGEGLKNVFKFKR